MTAKFLGVSKSTVHNRLKNKAQFEYKGELVYYGVLSPL